MEALGANGCSFHDYYRTRDGQLVCGSLKPSSLRCNLCAVPSVAVELAACVHAEAGAVRR